MKKLLSILIAIALMATMSVTVSAVEVEEHTHCVCGTTHAENGDHTAEDERTFSPIETYSDFVTAVAAGGNYYLTADITLEEELTVAADKEFALCLNGYIVFDNGYIGGLSSRIINKGAFIMTDCTANTRNFYFDDSGEMVEGTPSDPEVILKTFVGGIFANRYSNQGSLCFYGGNIILSRVSNYGDASFTMYGGNIILSGSSYSVDDFDGAVQNEGTFTMYGGTIEDSTSRGCAISDWRGTTNLYGGAVKNNTGTFGGLWAFDSNLNIKGNVNFQNNYCGTFNDNYEFLPDERCDFFLSESQLNIVGELTNTTPYYVIITNNQDEWSAGQITNGWSTYMGDADPADYFASTSDDYYVGLKNGEVWLIKTEKSKTTITYEVAPTYTVTIPATVALGETATIKAENVVVPKGKQVEVSLTDANGFTVATPQGAELGYTVKNGETTVNEGDAVLTVNPKDGKTGETTLSFVAPTEIQYAGTYTGTATFTISVKDVPKTIINFTIDGETFEAEEGMTWAEWIDSASNTIGLYLRGSADGVYWSWCCLIDATGAVKASDVIEAEAYTLVPTEC